MNDLFMKYEERFEKRYQDCHQSWLKYYRVIFSVAELFLLVFYMLVDNVLICYKPTLNYMLIVFGLFAVATLLGVYKRARRKMNYYKDLHGYISGRILKTNMESADFYEVAEQCEHKYGEIHIFERLNPAWLLSIFFSLLWVYFLLNTLNII